MPPANPINPRQEFIPDDVLRLEVEATPTGLVNLILNPGGEKGAWFWDTPVAASTITMPIGADPTYLHYLPTATSPHYFYSQVAEMAAGEWVAGYWLRAGSLYSRTRFEFINAAGSVISSTAQTAYATGGSHSVPLAGTTAAYQAPANTVGVRMRFDLYSNNAGGNPGPATPPAITATMDFWDVTMAKASSSGALAGLGYLEPYEWLNILGESHSITVDRAELNLGTLTAVIVDASLDPAEADEIAPGRLIRLQATDDAGVTWRNLFEGRIDSPEVSYTIDKTDPAGDLKVRIQLVAHDNIAVLANQGESRGVDIDDLAFILEGKGVPWNVNNTGNQKSSATVLSSNDKASMLDQVAIARDSAPGFAWVDRYNVLHATENPTNGSEPTFSDVSGVSYSAIDAGYVLDTVINEVTVVWLRYDAATGQTTEYTYGPYRDEASIKANGPRSATFTLQGAAESSVTIEAYADAVLAANATPVRRVSRLTVPIVDLAAVTLASNLDLYDLAHVDFSTIIDDDYRVTGIKHVITPDRWLTDVSFESDGSVARPQIVPSPSAGGNVVSGQWVAPAMQNAWVNFGSTYTTAAYRRDGNRVTLKGLIKSGVINSAAFTLPAGYRPAQDMHFPAHSAGETTGAASAGTAHTHSVPDQGGVNVFTDGRVVPRTGSSNTNFSLDGVSFIAEA